MGKWYEKREEQKARLIEATIRTIAANGLERSSVDDVCKEAGLNVAYVYRLFASKDELLLKTFEKLDTELFDFVIGNHERLDRTRADFEEKSRALFNLCWEYITARPDALKFYVWYYHSATFHATGYEEHIARFGALLKKLRPALPESADVTRTMHHIFKTLLNQALDYITHPVSTNEETRNACFAMIFAVAKLPSA